MPTLEYIQKLSRQFAEERNWQQYQSPKNLAMAMSVEAAELVEHFQWLTEEQSRQLHDEQRQEVSHEIADILFYLMRIVDVLDIDMQKAIDEKSQINEEKYPLSMSAKKDG